MAVVSAKHLGKVFYNALLRKSAPFKERWSVLLKEVEP